MSGYAAPKLDTVRGGIIGMLVGAKRHSFKYPLQGRISSYNEEGWLSDQEIKSLEKEYQPAIVKKIGELAKQIGRHGGRDFLMSWRIIGFVSIFLKNFLSALLIH